VLLIKLAPDDINERSDPNGWSYNGLVAYSKICTHAGCPVGLYEQHTHHLLCPCHQSTFDVLDNCSVVFGPAARPLPQLAIEATRRDTWWRSTTSPSPSARVLGARMSTLNRAAGGTGRFLDDRLGVPSCEEGPAQGLPRPLVVHDGRGRPLQLHHPAALRHVPLPVVQAEHGRGRLRRRYVPLQGMHMSEAYASTLDISFDVRGGLIMRQIHHWAALIFVASICVHLFRVFFTGAFRKPRELNWLIGVGLLTLALLEGFAGYTLPDDLLSGTGLRIAHAVMLSIPVVGTYLAFFVFGGEFPGDDFIPRLYTVHVCWCPASCSR
jgi:hypothetical protein